MKNIIFLFSFLFSVSLSAQKGTAWIAECLCETATSDGDKNSLSEIKNFQGIRLTGFSNNLVLEFPVGFSDVSQVGNQVKIKKEEGGYQWLDTSQSSGDYIMNYTSLSDLTSCLKSGGEGGVAGPQGPPGEDAEITPEVISEVVDSLISQGIPADAITSLKDSIQACINSDTDTNCWDLDQDGFNDPIEDVNNDGVWNNLDCGEDEDTDTYGTPLIADSGGIDYFGYSYVAGDNLVTFPDPNGGPDLVVCVPDKSTPILSEIGEQFEADSNCEFQVFDISTNDTGCTDENGNFIGQYIVTDISGLPDGVVLNVSPAGLLMLQFVDCPPIAFGLMVETYILCDGEVSNEATDIITYVPPPIGDIRNTNQFDVEIAATGDVINKTIVTCNDPNATGPITDITVTDFYDLNLTYISNDGGNSVGGAITEISTVPQLIYTFPGPLQPGECHSLDVAFEVTAPDGWELSTNITQAQGNDGINGPNSTTDSDIDVLNELQLAESRATVSEPNNSGVHVINFTHTKEPNGALITTCENHLVTFELIEEGVATYCVLEGNTCDDFGNYNLVSGFDMRPYLSGNTASGGSASINKKTWAEDTGHTYAADGSSIINGNTPITDLTAQRTFAQTIRIYTTIGGGNPVSTTCPIPSTNDDNFDDVCKSISSWIAASNYSGTEINQTEIFIRTNFNTNSDLNIADPSTLFINHPGAVNTFTQISGDARFEEFNSPYDYTTPMPTGYINSGGCTINGLCATTDVYFVTQNNSNQAEFYEISSQIAGNNSHRKFTINCDDLTSRLSFEVTKNGTVVRLNTFDSGQVVIDGTTYPMTLPAAGVQAEFTQVNHTFSGLGIFDWLATAQPTGEPPVQSTGKIELEYIY